MKWTHKIIWICPITLFFFIAFLHRTFAQTNKSADFSIGYNTVYTIDDELNTQVIKKGLLTNLSSTKYLPFIDLHFDTPNIKDLQAFDDFGPIAPHIDKTSSSSAVRITFNKPILGIGKKLSYTVQYTVNGLFVKQGNEQIFSLPRQKFEPHIVSYNVELKLPQSLGGKSYYWEKDQLQSRGITLIFKTQKGKVNTAAPRAISKSETTSFSEVISITAVLLIILTASICFLYVKVRKKNDTAAK